MSILGKQGMASNISPRPDIGDEIEVQGEVFRVLSFPKIQGHTQPKSIKWWAVQVEWKRSQDG